MQMATKNSTLGQYLVKSLDKSGHLNTHCCHRNRILIQITIFEDNICVKTGHQKQIVYYDVDCMFVYCIYANIVDTGIQTYYVS